MLIGVYIFCGIGLLFFTLGIIFAIIGKKIFKCTAETEGRIIDMCHNAYNYNYGGSGRVAIGVHLGGAADPGMSCPIFTYRVNGMEYTRASNISWNRGQIRRKMNKTRTIYYNPENPEQASLTKQSSLALIGKIFILVGGISIAAGLLISFIF